MNFISKKYIILLVLICLMFAGFIIKAFDYLPDKSVDSSTNVNIQKKKHQATSTTVKSNKKVSDDEDEDEDEDEGNIRKSHKSGHIDFGSKSQRSSIQAKQLDEINAPDGIDEESVQNPNANSNSSLSPEEEALKCVVNGKIYKLKSENSKAMSEFEKALTLTKNKEITAMCYENMSEIYASMRRYGKALTYANKAYNEMPSSYREMLIAKIYYKSGDTKTGTERMNALLNRNFQE